MGFEQLNALGKERKPFLFICDYKAQNIEVIEQEKLAESDVEFSIDANYITKNHPHTLRSHPLSFELYNSKFNTIIEKIKSGETYIINLTQPTPIETKLSLNEIYTLANAHYKIRFKDNFVCFSPETFVQIEADRIHTFPMKGTIDASKEDAAEIILADKKELAEHIMIVDLLRNDLSIVATNVKVEQFRYISEIEAGERKLLQVSSHISGIVGNDWHEKIGDILQALLPAGSITGAPKRSTVEIIQAVEGYDRGYFSGIFGFYDGEKLDSSVMIRFIEKNESRYIYKSGGGITLDSSALSEYNELQEKIYLP